MSGSEKLHSEAEGAGMRRFMINVTADFDGWIGELGAYTQVLSGSTLSDLETYLSSKWGISI